MKKAIIISPTYNEAKNVERLVTELAEVIKKISSWKVELLIVDDTSPDGTYKIVAQLQKKYKFLHLLINKQKSGLGGAYLKGMDHAFHKLGADVIFEFDADLSHDPQKIPALLKKIDQGNDLVLGSRYVKGGSIPSNWGLHRKFLSVFGNLVIMFVITDFRIRDWTAGFRAITKEVYEAVHKEMSAGRFTGYTFQIGFLHKAVRRGFKVAEVPINFVDRVEGESKLGAEYIKNTLLYILKARYEEIVNHRIFKFLVTGTIGALTQLISLQIFRLFVPTESVIRLQIANLGAVEMAMIATFGLNNVWTFADRKLPINKWLAKFFQFNLTASGSVLIQAVVFFLGIKLIGMRDLFTLPIINYPIDTPPIFSAVGILIGMFWNFFAYNKFIWKHNKK